MSTQKINKRLGFIGIFLLLIAVTLSFTANGPFFLAAQDSPATSPADETRIIIFHYNDAHAKIESLPKIAWYVAEERKKNEHVFFLNGGDNFSGNPVVDMAEPKGEPVRLLMNMMALDVLTLGNHEFDYGQQVLNNFMRQANYAIICANVKMNTDALPQPDPFKILTTKNGIKIAVLGVVEVSRETGIPSSHPQNLKGLIFSDPIETAKTFRSLRKDNQVFVLLSHMGMEDDVVLSNQMGELDLIVGGHSHTTILEPKTYNGVLITQAGGQGQFLGRIELIVKNGKVIQKSGSLIEVKTIKEGIPEMEKMVATFNDNPVLDSVVGTLSRSLYGNYELGHLVTDSIRISHHLDIAFHNSGGIRASKLGKKVTVKDIYTLNPFGNRVICIKMTPEEIRSLLRSDFERYKTLDIKISGISYTVKYTPDFKVTDIDIRDLNGKRLDETKTYLVGMNDYMTLTYKFDHQDPGKSLEVTLAQTVMDYLKIQTDACVGVGKVRAYAIMVPTPSLIEIGKTKVEISAGDETDMCSTTAGNLIADAIRISCRADIAFYPHRAQQIGAFVPGPGPLYRENIMALYPFANKNKVITVFIKGEAIQPFLLERCRLTHGIDLQVSGLKYSIKLDNQGKVVAVDCVLPNGKKLLAKTIYSVAFNDFELTKHYNLDKVIIRSVTSTETVAQILLDYIKSKGTITASIKEQRVKIIRDNKPRTKGE